MQRNDLNGASVVITGASSGIGRATALGFARKGANVAVAARRAEPLWEVAEECRKLGVRAIDVPTDVRSMEAMENLADQAVREFGGVDVWVNNAGVFLTGRFEDIPLDVARDMFETNLFGVINGMRLALALMRRQGWGLIVNVSSLDGKIGAPMQSFYAASKFAVTGLSESVNNELIHNPDINICAVHPAFIDTPLFQHGGNYSGRKVKPGHPIYEAQQVADTIVRAAEHPVREVMVGNAGRMMVATRRLAPPLAEMMITSQIEKDTFYNESSPDTSGNIREPMAEWTSIDGNWRQAEGILPGSPAMWSQAATAGAALGVGWMLWKGLKAWQGRSEDYGYYEEPPYAPPRPRRSREPIEHDWWEPAGQAEQSAFHGRNMPEADYWGYYRARPNY